MPVGSLVVCVDNLGLHVNLATMGDEGRLKGIPLDSIGNNQLLFQLFADNTSLFLQASEENFREARAGIAQFELSQEPSSILRRQLLCR